MSESMGPHVEVMSTTGSHVSRLPHVFLLFSSGPKGHLRGLETRHEQFLGSTARDAAGAASHESSGGFFRSVQPFREPEGRTA